MGALDGAETGAEVGSAIPGVGTVIGAGVGALAGHFLGGKKGSAQDRANQLAAQAQLAKTSTQQSAEGENDTGAASRYYQSLLSGDPTSIARATQPVANATAAQADQARRVAGQVGGNRSGGTNSTDQTVQQNADATTADAVSKAQGGAAAPLAQIGEGETSHGITATSDLGSLATASNAQSTAKETQQGKDLGAFASSPEAAKFAKGVAGFLMKKPGASAPALDDGD